MSTSVATLNREPIVIAVAFSEDMICLTLDDGRIVQTPIEFYPRLAHATQADLADFRIMGGGTGIRWEKLDEDLSTESIVAGRRAFNAPR